MPRVTFDPNVYVRNDSPKCPICLSNADVYRRLDVQDLFEGLCEVCGDINITLAAAEKARNSGRAYLLSAALKRRPGGRDYATTKLEDVERILKDSPDYDVLEKVDLALSLVVSMTRRPGEQSSFKYDRDYPLASASSPDEALFYLRYLSASDYLEFDGGIVKATVEGYRRVQELQAKGRQSSVAFVAMWFDPSRDSIYDEAIKPAYTMRRSNLRSAARVTTPYESISSNM